MALAFVVLQWWWWEWEVPVAVIGVVVVVAAAAAAAVVVDNTGESRMLVSLVLSMVLFVLVVKWR